MTVARGVRRLAAVCLVLVGAACLLTACRRGPSAEDPEALLAALRERKAEVDRRTDDLLRRLDEYNRSRAAGQREIQFTELFAPDLSPEQKKLLDEILAQEQDATYKGLLEQIRKDRDDLLALQEKIADLESKLPDKFQVAKRGDTHYGIALRYLKTDQGLPEEEARRALADVNLFEDLNPGNHVYLFYDRDKTRFGTYVTQGEAKASPLAVQRAVRRRLIAERDAARTDAAALQGQMASLEKQIGALQEDLRSLEEKRSRVQADLETALRDADRVRHSVFYHVASERELEQAGIVKDGVFTRPQLDDPSLVEYEESLDLRSEAEIVILPGAHRLARITRVIVFPRFLDEGRDWSTGPGEGAGIVLRILRPEAFQGQRILIAVKD